MSRNTSGVRATARRLRRRLSTGLTARRKKAAARAAVNMAPQCPLNADAMAGPIERAGEAAMDAMWRFVGQTKRARWVWQAIDHCPGAVLA
jgi:hypothetical protein